MVRITVTKKSNPVLVKMFELAIESIKKSGKPANTKIEVRGQ